MRVSEFIERCRQAEGPTEVFQLFRHAVTEIGYDRLGFIPVTPAARGTLGLPDVAPAAAANVPESWLKHYFDNGYADHDPVLLLTPLRDRPLVWDELPRSEPLTARQRKVMAESRDAGLHNGVSIPLHGPLGECYVTSFATETTRGGNLDRLPHLQLLAHQFLLSYVQSVRETKSGRPSPTLSERERECLTWTARGKSAWAIGRIVGISEHTVNFHLKSAMAKLGSTNRMQAVVTAIRLGLILP